MCKYERILRITFNYNWNYNCCKKTIDKYIKIYKLKVNKQYNKARQFFYVLLFNYKSAILPIVHEKGEIKVHEQTRT